MKKSGAILLLNLLPLAMAAQYITIETNFKQGHRAMEISDSAKVLLAGSNSSVLLVDSKSGFHVSINPKRKDTLEYRAAEVLNDSTYIIANAGSPAYVFKSTDYGKNWRIVYQNNHPSAFIDGMATLYNGHIMLYGDQINEKFLALESLDAGETWQEISSFPKPKTKSDAGFAASDAGIIVHRDTVFVAISGKKENYVLMSPNAGKTWDVIKTNLQIGEGAGAFAMAYSNGNLLLVGGSYVDFNNSVGNINILNVKARQFIEIENPPNGYKSGVACYKNTCISTGTIGTDISFDAGVNWKKLNDTRFFTVKFKGDRFYLSGPKGQYAQYKLNTL